MLYKRTGTPHWWVRFRVRGIEVRRSTGTSIKAHAEEFERKLREEAWRQSRLGVSRHTWKEATTRWLEQKAGKRSLTRDKEAFEIVSPYLDASAMDEITGNVLAKLRHVLESEPKKARETKHVAPQEPGLRKPATVARILAVVRSVLKACVEWEWLTVAPHVSMPEIEDGDPRFISHKEFRRLLKELPPHVRAIAAFAVETGQRKSAITRLKWSAVDMKRRHAFISSSTSKSKRAVPLPLNNGAMAVLEKQEGKHETYVFTDQLGRAPVGSVKTAWGKAIKRAGLPGFRFHDLRHTWASWQTMAGTPLQGVRELGGWASLAMVERYSHLSAEHLRQWAETGTREILGTKNGTAKGKKPAKRLVS